MISTSFSRGAAGEANNKWVRAECEVRSSSGTRVKLAFLRLRPDVQSLWHHRMSLKTSPALGG